MGLPALGTTLGAVAGAHGHPEWAVAAFLVPVAAMNLLGKDREKNLGELAKMFVIGTTAFVAVSVTDLGSWTDVPSAAAIGFFAGLALNSLLTKKSAGEASD